MSCGIFVNRTTRTLGPSSSDMRITHRHNYLQSQVPVLSSNAADVDHSDSDSFHSTIQNLYLHYGKKKRLETSSKVTLK